MNKTKENTPTKYPYAGSYSEDGWDHDRDLKFYLNVFDDDEDAPNRRAFARRRMLEAYYGLHRSLAIAAALFLDHLEGPDIIAAPMSWKTKALRANTCERSKDDIYRRHFAEVTDQCLVAENLLLEVLQRDVESPDKVWLADYAQAHDYLLSASYDLEEAITVNHDFKVDFNPACAAGGE